MSDEDLLALAGSLRPDDRPEKLKGALNRGLSFNPDEYAKAVKLSAQTGVVPTAVLRDMKTFDRPQIDPAAFVNMNPRTADWLIGNADHAAMAHDDLPTLQEIEDASRNLPQGLTAGQRDVLIQERLRVLGHNKPRNEASSLASTAGMGFSGPVLSSAETLAAVPSLLSEAFGAVGDFLTGPQTLDATARRIAEAVKDPYQKGTLGGDVAGGTGYLRAGWTEPIKTGPSQYLTDPTTGKTFENPDYHWYGRDTVQTLAGVPGAAAFFALTGKAGVNMTVANAGREKYQQAIREGADPVTALMEGTGSAGVNYLLMNKMPHPVQSQTVLSQVAQAGGRGVTLGLGVTAAENTLGKLHGSDRPLWEGATQNIISMTGFEALPVISRLVQATGESKLKARSPEAFKSAVETILKGSEAERFMIPAERATTFFQETGTKPEDFGPDVARSYTEALAAGTDVTIPTADFLASRLKPEQMNTLLQDIRLRPTDMTIRELTAFEAEAQKVVEDLKTQAEPAPTEAPAQSQIADDIQGQLEAAGRHPSTAETEAQIYAKVITNLATREGLDPMELHAKYGLKVFRPNPGETAVDAVLGRAAQGDPLGANADFYAEHPEMDPLYWQSQHKSVNDLAQQFEAQGLNLHVNEGKGGITLAKVVVPEDLRGQGVGTTFMTELAAYADSTGQRIALTPSKDFGASSIGRLKEFYKRFGFVENKGKNKDFAVSEAMYREPSKTMFQNEPLGVRLDRLREELRLRQGATNADLQPNPEPRTTGITDAQGSRGVRQDSAMDPNGGQGLRSASGEDAARRIREHATPEGLDAFYRAPVVYRDPEPVTFHSWDGSSKEFEAAVQGRDIFVYDKAELPEGTNRGNIHLEVLPEGDLFVRFVHNGESRGVGMFLYQEAIRRAMENFPEVKRDSMVIGETSVLGTKARMRLPGTDVLKGRDGNVSATPVGDFLDYQTDQLSSKLRELGLNLSMSNEDIAAKMAGDAGSQTFFQPAYHGSPFRFDKFTLDHIGKGEGAQAYGWGLYFAGNKQVAEYYRKSLSSSSDMASYTWNGKRYEARSGPEAHALALAFHESIATAKKIAKGGLADVEKGDPYALEMGKDYWQKMLDTANAIKSKREVKQDTGQLYRVDIPDSGYLLWDKPLSEQSESVKKAVLGDLDEAIALTQKGLDGASERKRYASEEDLRKLESEKSVLLALNGSEFYKRISNQEGSDEAASKYLNENGIVGIKYLDGNSRGAGEGQHNYVIFDANAVKTLETYYQPEKRNPDEYQRLRTRLASLRSLSPSHQAGELNRRADEIKVAEAEFAAFEAGIKEVQAGDIHESKRGFIQFSPERQVSIGLLEKADLSTFSHEMHHMFLEVMGDLAQAPGASEGMKSDYAAILKYLGVESRDQITVAEHEKFARTGEAVLWEGKAAPVESGGIFQRVKAWMQLVYAKMEELGIKLNDDVRGVFQRMYATDAEIERAKQVVDTKPMFATAEAMGVSQAEYDAYVRAGGKSIETARDATNAKLMREYMRERSANWKAESAKLAERIAEEVNNEPVYQAFKALTEGALPDGTPIKLNKEALEAQIGEGKGKDLPRGWKRIYAREGGMDAEAAAEILGFQSGDQLIEALRNMEPRKDRIKRLTQETMKATHGDMMTDGSMAESVVEAMHNQSREEVLFAELKALRKTEAELKPGRDLQRKIDEAKSEEERQKAKEAWDAFKAEQKTKAKENKAQAREAMAVPPVQAFRDAARELVSQSTTRELDPYRYLTTSRKLAREAFEAMGKDDFAKAAEAKQKELLNHHLYLEATKAKEEAGKIAEYGRDSQTPKFQGKLGKAGQGYLEQFNALASRYEFRKVTNIELDQRAQNLKDWADEQAKMGAGIVIDPALYIEGKPKNWREVPLSELRAVRDGLKNIETVARNQRKVMDGEKTADFETAVHELDSTARGNLKSKAAPLDPLTRSTVDKAVGQAKKLNSELVKMERVIDHLDQGDINGAWRRYIFEPMALAQFKEYELTQKVTNLLADAMETMPKDQRHSLLDIHDIPGIGKVTKKFILSMALNWGNASNREKMLKGMGWADRPEAVGKAFDKLNRADWEFVQKTWDAIDTLWPEISALQVRMTGIEPPRVEREAFGVTLADGSKMDLAGGYYPVVYDKTKSSQGAMQADTDIMNSEGGFTGPVTFKGHTVERVKFSAPLNMDFESVLIRHTSQVIKDISHREAAMSVSKLIRDQRVRSALSETMGQEYTDQLMPWLKGTVNDNGGSQGIEGWKGMLMGLRSNMVLAGLSFRAGSVLVQVTDLGRAMTRVKSAHLGQALVDFAAHPVETTQMVRELSSEMRGRSENLDRDAREALKRLQGKDTYKAHIQKFGMKGLAVADTVTSVTTWLGQYRQSLAEGAPKEQAIREADRTVRLTMMSSAPKDLVALQRVGDVGAKFFTMFMGDATATYGIMNEGVRQIGLGKDVGSHLFTMTMVGMVIPLLGQLIKNRGPRDDEDKAWWLAKNSLLALPSSIPIARDIAQSLDSGQDYKFTPIANALDKTVKSVRFAGKFAQGEAEWDDAFMKTFDAVGTLGGLPGTSQIMTTGNYLRKVKKGKERPKGPVEFAAGAVFGAPPKAK